MQAEIDQWKQHFKIHIVKRSYGYRLDQGTKRHLRKDLFYSTTAKTELEFLTEMAQYIQKHWKLRDSIVIGPLGRNCCMELLKVFEMWVPDYRYVNTPEKKKW
jgi:hypothetical protein